MDYKKNADNKAMPSASAKILIGNETLNRETKNSYDRVNAPLDCEVMELLYMIRMSIGCCALSGSAALCELLHQMDPSQISEKVKDIRRVTKNNDVDFFVPLFPNLQNAKERKVFPNDEKLKTFHELFETKIVPGLRNFQYNGPEQKGERRRYNFPGIHSMIELIPKNGRPKVQIIVLDKIVSVGLGDWDNEIPKRFDINIVKLKVDYEGPQNLKPIVTFVDPTGKDCLKQGCFDYVVHPHQDFEICQARIVKYIQERHFTMRSLAFDNRMAELTKRDWLMHARRSQCSQLIRLMLEEKEAELLERNKEHKQR